MERRPIFLDMKTLHHYVIRFVVELSELITQSSLREAGKSLNTDMEWSLGGLFVFIIF